MPWSDTGQQLNPPTTAAKITDASATGRAVLTGDAAAGRTALAAAAAGRAGATLWFGTQAEYDALPTGTRNAAGFVAVISS